MHRRFRSRDRTFQLSLKLDLLFKTVLARGWIVIDLQQYCLQAVGGRGDRFNSPAYPPDISGRVAEQYIAFDGEIVFVEPRVVDSADFGPDRTALACDSFGVSTRVDPSHRAD